MDTEQSSRDEVDPGFQAWCEGRPHGIPAERRAMKVSLFLTAFLAMHRVKASATPDQHFDPRHPRSRGDDRQQEAFCRPLAREGGGRQNSPHRRQADPISEPGASREGEALLARSPTSMPGPAGTGSASAAAGQFCGGQAASIGARGRLDPVAGAGLMFTAKAHLRKHRDLLQPPCDCLPQSGAAVGFVTCNTCDGRNECRQRGGHFWRLLAREGGRPTKFPRSRRYSRSRGGQGRRQVGRAAGASREVVLGRPGAVARSGRRRQAGLSWERVRACWGRARMGNRSIRGEQAISIGTIEEGAGIWSAFRLPD